MTGHVGVVVVTYNSRATIDPCLASVDDELRCVAHDVVVVDNASTDGTAGWVEQRWPAVQVVRSAGNDGFAAGVNLGFEALPRDTDPILVLNPDAVLGPGSVAALRDALDEPHVGIAAPRLVTSEGTSQPTVHHAASLRRALVDALLGGAAAQRLGGIGDLVPHATDGPAHQDVSWAGAAVWLMSRSCAEAVGRWDESFFLYSEEVDFAERARARGFRFVFVRDAVCVHDGGASASRPADQWALLVLNKVRVRRRYHGRARGAGHYLVALGGEALRSWQGDRRRITAVRALLRAAVVGLPAAADELADRIRSGPTEPTARRQVPGSPPGHG